MFPDDASCLEHLWRQRYAPDGEHAECPKCEHERVFKKYATAQGRQSWTCTGCGHHVHPTAGTIFAKSSTSLHLWYFAMYMMTSTRCGISAKQLERETGVSYRTAWRMLNKIRNELMADDGQAAHFLGVPVRIGDDPVPGDQLAGHLAAVPDRDRVGEGVLAGLPVRLLGQVTDRDGRRELGCGHEPILAGNARGET